jgi:hypothetical protein
MTADGAWPEKPYRGLNYFRRQDRPLLAGREDDVRACAEVLAHPDTRVLMLHGSTGCGKSSFLRAGLVPILKEEGAGFHFVRWDPADDESLFIRCTASPMAQIAAQLHTFASQPFPVRTPRGEVTIDLAPARLGAESWERYLQLVLEEEGALLRSLRALAAAMPQMPVLIVDQSEEVLTLVPGQEGVRDRVLFFTFLREFQRLKVGARILLALRTEYLGRFLDATQVSYRQTAGFRHYYLTELHSGALEEVVELPTRRKAIPPWGVPYETYRFKFEAGLPAKIVRDVQEALFSGPALPVLQLVCLGLYEGRRKPGADDHAEDDHAEIVEKDYVTAGAAQGQIILHVQRSLATVASDEEKVLRLRDDILTGLYLIQDDGTMVARTRARAWACDQLQRVLGPGDAGLMLEQLGRPETLVLRLLRNVKPDGGIADEVTLGHDCIALAVERWRAQDAAKKAQEAETRRLQTQRRGRIVMTTIGGACLLITAVWIAAVLHFGLYEEIEQFVTIRPDQAQQEFLAAHPNVVTNALRWLNEERAALSVYWAPFVVYLFIPLVIPALLVMAVGAVVLVGAILVLLGNGAIRAVLKRPKPAR